MIPSHKSIFFNRINHLTIQPGSGTVVSDSDQSPLPGVTVTLTGAGAPQVQATDAQGKFRFLGLSPGSYAVKAEIEGFAPIEKTAISVNIGRNTNVEILQPSVIGATVNVIDSSPLLDPHRHGQGQAQITPSNSGTAFAFNGDKIKTGRNAGPLRPQETTWDQSAFGPGLTGMYSVVNGGFQLAPEGGSALAYRDPSQRWHNSFLLNQLERPQKQGKLDAANFFETGGFSNELKYGAGYRTAEQSSLFTWPGGGLELAVSDDTHLLFLVREASSRVKTDYGSAYLQDTLSRGSLTANVGLRYDRQGGRNLSSRAAANSVFPDLLPETQYADRGRRQLRPPERRRRIPPAA